MKYRDGLAEVTTAQGCVEAWEQGRMTALQALVRLLTVSDSDDVRLMSVAIIVTTEREYEAARDMQ